MYKTIIESELYQEAYESFLKGLPVNHKVTEKESEKAKWCIGRFLIENYYEYFYPRGKARKGKKLNWDAVYEYMVINHGI